MVHSMLSISLLDCMRLCHSPFAYDTCSPNEEGGGPSFIVTVYNILQLPSCNVETFLNRKEFHSFFIASIEMIPINIPLEIDYVWMLFK